MGPARRLAARSAARLVAAGLMMPVMACSGHAATPHGQAAPATSGSTTTATTTAPAIETTTTPASTAPATALLPAAAGPCGVTTTPPQHYRHVIWIWMENHQWQQVLGDPAAAPYEIGLARKCATATHYASVGSPSLPNYLGATSGDSHGIQDDSGPAAHPLSGDNLFRQVRASGGREQSFPESMGPPCRQDSAGSYAVKHNPAAYYVGGSDRVACIADDVDLAALLPELAAGTLPTFAFITPDLCHDTHDCPVATGDAWLALWVPRILASPAYRDGSTAVFVMWDEYTPMPNVVVAPSVPAGTSVSEPFDHYSLLRTTEEMVGLPLLGRATGATSMRGPFRL
jgi:phosphatidylinositol-3-phosphatase